MRDEELEQLFRGYGYEPLFVEGDEPATMHRRMADALETAFDQIRAIQSAARERRRSTSGRAWPMIVLRTPEGLDRARKRSTGMQGRGHLARAPGADRRPARAIPSISRMLEAWMKSYRPEELFDEGGALRAGVARRWRPQGDGAWARIRTPMADCCCASCKLPEFRDYAVDVAAAGRRRSAKRRACLGEFLRDVVSAQRRTANFRVVRSRRDGVEPPRCACSR